MIGCLCDHELITIFSLKVVLRSCQPWRRSLRGWGRQGTVPTRTCTRPPNSVWQTGQWWSDTPPPRWVIDWKTENSTKQKPVQWVIEWETCIETYYFVVQKNNLCVSLSRLQFEFKINFKMFACNHSDTFFNPAVAQNCTS